MGTMKIEAGKLSFSDQLDELVGPNYREEIDDMDPENVTHSDFTTSRSLSISTDRDRPHRPQVPEQLDDDLTKAVRENTNVPGEKLDFDDRLELFLDVVEQYYRVLDCYLKG
jgi:hypothetical protein